MESPKRLIIKPGQRFNMLTIIHEVPKHKTRRHFLCKCDCGQTREVALIRLTTGKTRSCGCIAIKILKQRFTTHGMGGHPLYNVWNSMKQRCSNPKQRAYYRYGGRGIRVCNEWLRFEPFKNWALSNGYKEDLTLERVDNDGNYEPDNCAFVSKKRQANNRKTNRFIDYKGETMTLADWGRRVGISPIVLLKRLNRGWSIEKSSNTPSMKP